MEYCLCQDSSIYHSLDGCGSEEETELYEDSGENALRHSGRRRWPYFFSNDEYRVGYIHLTFGVPIDFYDQTSTRTVSTIPLAEKLFDVAT